MTKIVAIVPARGGSKGIPRKNLRLLCGVPLVAWSVLRARQSEHINSVWVTSDDEEILAVAKAYGARAILRPAELSGDAASSESAWLHALDVIERAEGVQDLVVGLQPTSPIREATDIDSAINQVRTEGLDTLLSVTEVEDYFSWRATPTGPESINYDYRLRKRRQSIEKTYLENGSFYIFSPRILRSSKNRLGGKIGLYVMDRHKMFQIDRPEDIGLCEAIMRGYGLDKE